MYKCRECGRYFEEPRKYTDWVPYGSTSVPLDSYTCPCCDGSDFDNADVVEDEELREEEEDEEEEVEEEE